MAARLGLYDGEAIVIDNGTSTIKYGFAGNDAPSSVIPTVIAKCKFQSSMVGMGQSPHNIYIGQSALKKRGIPINLTYPIQRGIITNWDDIQTIYQHLFNQEIGVQSSEYPILLTDTQDENKKFYRHKMTEVMFETFNVPAMGIENQNVLSLFASGNTTGFTIDSGKVKPTNSLITNIIFFFNNLHPFYSFLNSQISAFLKFCIPSKSKQK